jgi:hypothetical protein
MGNGPKQKRRKVMHTGVWYTNLKETTWKTRHKLKNNIKMGLQ